MEFAISLKMMIAKPGLPMRRAGWNASGMWVEVQVPDEHSKMTHPYLFINVPDCEEGLRKLPWQPSQVDLFAEDWTIVETKIKKER